MKIAIIGAGNGGQAMAAHFALLGHEINLYNRSLKKLKVIVETNKIWLNDKIKGVGRISLISDKLEEVIKDCKLLMITTTADAHHDIAQKIAPYVEDNQIMILNPGRTLGALEFSKILRSRTSKRVFIAEAHSLIYACRVDTVGSVRVIGVKDKVLLAAYPKTDTELVLKMANSIYNCFIRAENILHTSLENIGAIFHPAIIILNAAAIERGNLFYFYNEMTPAVASLLEGLDTERIKIGNAFGLDLKSASDWISYAYDDVKVVESENLFQKMKANPAYREILAPNTLHSRLLLEDIPTGVLPFLELAKLAGIETPLLNSVLNIAERLLDRNFHEHGRTLVNLGLGNIDFKTFKEKIENDTIC